MDNDQTGAQDKSYRGYDTPGEDKLISNTSEDIPSPSVTSRQRMEAPAPYIGGDVNEKPGDDNPALAQTIGFEEGKTDTADLLLARESAEEHRLTTEKYADQATDDEAEVPAGQVPYDIHEINNPEEAIYKNRESHDPEEPSELDTLGLRTPNLPPADGDRH